MISKKSTVVVALGGNAISREFEEGNIYQQFANTRRSLLGVAELIEEGQEVVITHGNGPQVGAILLQNDLARDITPPMPLGICVAESEGLIGYMIQQCLSNALQKGKIDRPVVALITQVIVDENDPSFKNPTKPIGPFYTEQEAIQIQENNPGVTILEDSGRGYRRVVP